MENSSIAHQSLLSLIVAIVLSMGVFSGTVRADGDFLTPFTPAYPELGGSYEDFVFLGDDSVTIIPANALAPLIPPDDVTIDFPSLLDDPNILPAINERCDTNAEGALQFAVAATRAADLLGNTICNAITPDTAESPCWIAFGILQQGFHVAETFVQQCDFQDALVDGAEIEAGFENTVKLIGLGTKIYEHELEENLLNCRQVVGLILPETDGGLAEWVATFVQDRINQYAPIISDPDRIVTAQANLDAANIDFAAAQYEDAYAGYCKAYGSLVAGKGRG